MPRDYKTIQASTPLHERFREDRSTESGKVGIKLSDAQFLELLLKLYEEQKYANS